MKKRSAVSAAAKAVTAAATQVASAAAKTVMAAATKVARIRWRSQQRRRRLSSMYSGRNGNSSNSSNSNRVIAVVLRWVKGPSRRLQGQGGFSTLFPRPRSTQTPKAMDNEHS